MGFLIVNYSQDDDIESAVALGVKTLGRITAATGPAGVFLKLLSLIAGMASCQGLILPSYLISTFVK